MSKSFFTIGSLQLKLIRSGYCIYSCSYKSIMWFACLLVIPWYLYSKIKLIMTVCAVPYTYNGILQRVIIVVSYVSIIRDRFKSWNQLQVKSIKLWQNTTPDILNWEPFENVTCQEFLQNTVTVTHRE